MLLKKQERWQEKINLTLTKRHCSHVGDKNKVYRWTLHGKPDFMALLGGVLITM